MALGKQMIILFPLVFRELKHMEMFIQIKTHACLTKGKGCVHGAVSISELLIICCRKQHPFVCDTSDSSVSVLTAISVETEFLLTCEIGSARFLE